MKLRARTPWIRSTTRSLMGMCLLLGLTACGSQPSQTTPQAEPAPPAASGPERHDLRGKVVSIDKAAKSVVVDHEEIPGFMAAMAMPYAVKDETLLDNLTPGDPVTAEVVVDDSGSMWLENIVAGPKPAP
ncbi:MAG: copper-binding protein [Terriglobia bacterium]